MRSPPSADQPRSVSILGATGSIGTSTAAVIAEAPEFYRVEAVTGGGRVSELARVARTLKARFAAIADPAAYVELKSALAGTGIEAGAGPEALIEAAQRPAEWVMSAVVGFAGLVPTLAAVRRGAMLALANKECIVCAGSLLLAEARAANAIVLPVDSEHNAIFQALGAGVGRHTAGVPVSCHSPDVERILLTASGGPFRSYPIGDMAAATLADALAHPTWSMGAKITIDSATMMNKGLEIIEAHHLFDLPEERIEVVVHPQSIIHSLVAFRDGSFLAQLGVPDMRIPIAHTLGWPGRLDTSAPRLDLGALGRLEFEPPDPRRFPALGVARRALRAGDGAPTVLNAANEVAVSAFLKGQIGFLDIVRVAEMVLDRSSTFALDGLAAVMACDAEARRRAAEVVAQVATRNESLVGPFA